MNELLLKLLKTQSYSGNEERVANFIISRLKGFKVKRQIVGKNRFNIVAQKGNSKIWLVAHMDTVRSWVKPRIEKDKIYGRGSVDNKGNIAAAIEAGKKLDDINLCFTVGEERDFIGAKFAKKIIKNDLAIVMEPTNFQVYSGQRGMIDFEVSTEGKQYHSAYVKDKDNAIQKITEILSELSKENWTAFNIGKIEGGTAANIVPSKAKASLSVRPESREEFEFILRKIKKYKIINKFPPRFNQKIKGKMLKVFTEMAFLPNSICFGVGDIKQAHSDAEFIFKRDLNLAPDRIIGLVKRLSRNIDNL